MSLGSYGLAPASRSMDEYPIVSHIYLVSVRRPIVFEYFSGIAPNSLKKIFGLSDPTLTVNGRSLGGGQAWPSPRASNSQRPPHQQLPPPTVACGSSSSLLGAVSWRAAGSAGI